MIKINDKINNLYAIFNPLKDNFYPFFFQHYCWHRSRQNQKQHSRPSQYSNQNYCNWKRQNWLLEQKDKQRWDKNSKHYLQKVKVGTQETKGSNYRILPKNSQELAEKGCFRHSKNSYGKDYAAHKAYKVNYLVEDLKVYSLHWRIIHRLDQNQVQICYLSQKKEGPFKMKVACQLFISFFDAFCPYSINVAFGYLPLSLDDSWDKTFVLGQFPQFQLQHEGKISCLPSHERTYILIQFFCIHPFENDNRSWSQKYLDLECESHYFHEQKSIFSLYHNFPKQQNNIRLQIDDKFQFYKTYQYYHHLAFSYLQQISMSDQAICISFDLQNHHVMIICFRQRNLWLAIQNKLELESNFLLNFQQESYLFYFYLLFFFFSFLLLGSCLSVFFQRERLLDRSLLLLGEQKREFILFPDGCSSWAVGQGLLFCVVLLVGELLYCNSLERGLEEDLIKLWTTS